MTNAKIVVVEDEIIVAKDIQNRLKRFGYNVPAVASSGEEALVKVAENYPDLVLMDIRLKGEIDGIETARQIYTQFNIPIIYLTAYADDNTIERAKVTEAFGYLLKPFKERELYTSIEVTLSKHRMERQLKQHEQWLDTVLRSIGDGVITNDVNGSVTFMNSIAEDLTGWKQEDALGKTVIEVFNIADETTGNPVNNPALEAIKEGGVVVSPPTVLIAKNGTVTPIDDSAAPIIDDKGNITGAVLVFRDISERKRIEEARRKQVEQERLIAQLEKLNRIKDDFLSTVSHELRTPMSNMKMAIQMLITQSTAERRQRYLEILQAECNREIELINDLLDLQRLEVASYPSFLVEAVSIKDLLSTVVEPFRSRMQERQQTLQVNFPIDLAPLCSDRASLERILAELLNNACKYTPSGGQIILSVQQVSTPDVASASLCASTTATLFTISNQAEIPAAELLRIFDKFYRVPNADPWKQGGTGLGLALVQKLVEQLQGTILPESGEGWTTFTLQLTNLVRE